jgi:hypothetical protein
MAEDNLQIATLILNDNIFKTEDRYMRSSTEHNASTEIIITDGTQVQSAETKTPKKQITTRSFKKALLEAEKARRRSSFYNKSLEELEVEIKRRDAYGNPITKCGGRQKVTFADQVGKSFRQIVLVESFKSYNALEVKEKPANCCGRCLIF